MQNHMRLMAQLLCGGTCNSTDPTPVLIHIPFVGSALTLTPTPEFIFPTSLNFIQTGFLKYPFHLSLLISKTILKDCTGDLIHFSQFSSPVWEVDFLYEWKKFSPPLPDVGLLLQQGPLYRHQSVQHLQIWKEELHPEW